MYQAGAHLIIVGLLIGVAVALFAESPAFRTLVFWIAVASAIVVMALFSGG